MASISTLVDRVKIVVQSSGTGPFQLGQAVAAYRGTEALLDGATYSYAVENGAQFEVGTGQYIQASGMLTRVVQISSTGGSVISFPANIELNFTALAADIVATGAALPITNSLGNDPSIAVAQQVVTAGLNGKSDKTFSHSENYEVGTIGRKLTQTINVMDAPFNAQQGTTADMDAASAFEAAFAACPPGGTIETPPFSQFYLSRNPDPATFSVIGGIGHNTRGKYVNWRIHMTTQLYGPGFGLPDANGIKYMSPISNPFNQVMGEYLQYDFRKQVTLNGGALIGDCRELVEDFGYDFPTTFTANLTPGSSSLSSASLNLVGKVKRGDLIESTAAGWPQPGVPRYRVWDVTANSIVFGVDLGAGPGGPTNWSGAVITGASFKIYKKQWMALEQRAWATGGPDSKDMAYGGNNYVAAITGAATNIIEMDMIALSDAGGLPSRGLFLTGDGDAPAIMYAVDIQRAGKAPWTGGVTMRAVDTGIYMNAKKAMDIDAIYNNPWTGQPEPLNYGIKFSGSGVSRQALLQGRQLTDGSQAIVLLRNTDTNPNPNGRYVQGLTADAVSETWYVDIQGGGHFSTLQLGQVPIATPDVPITSTMVIQASDGFFYKVGVVGRA
jgi:hypothetical protein